MLSQCILYCGMHFSNPAVESLLSTHFRATSVPSTLSLDMNALMLWSHTICGFTCVTAGSVCSHFVWQMVVYHVWYQFQGSEEGFDFFKLSRLRLLEASGMLRTATHHPAQRHTSRTKFDSLLSTCRSVRISRRTNCCLCFFVLLHCLACSSARKPRTVAEREALAVATKVC